MSKIHILPGDEIRTAETTGGLERIEEMGFSSQRDLLEALKGKRVLDLGSGAGFFAKEAYAKLGDKTFIVSMNKRLGKKEYRSEHERVDKEKLLSNESPGFIEQAIRRYRESALQADWANLPFRTESFDFIFSAGAFLFYQGTYSAEVLRHLILLLKRNTGELRIEVVSVDDDARAAMREAQRLGCSVEAHHSLHSFVSYLIIKRGDN